MNPSINETQFKKSFVRKLLEQLIRKYERSRAFLTGQPSRVRPQLSMSAPPFAKDYYDEMDFRKREWMNEALLELERRGLISLGWVKFQTGREVSKVFLRLETLPLAYELAGMVPKEEKMERLRTILRPLANHPWIWVREWRETTDESLSARKTAGLDIDDPQSYADLVKVLLVLPELDCNTPKRLLSQALFKDSKHFEQMVEQRLLALLRNASGMEFERDDEYLDEAGIVQNPKPVYACGPVIFEIDGADRWDMSRLPGGFGLSWQTVRAMRICSLGAAKRIVTVENLTSYHQWIARRDGEPELVVYLGGFPHRTLQLFLGKLADFVKAQTSPVPVYHWGDIDLGGIRIFEYLKAAWFPNVQPLWMDKQTFLKYMDRAMPVHETYLSKARDMLVQPKYQSWREMISLIIQYGFRLEQESIMEIDPPF